MMQVGFYASLWSYDMQVHDVIICKFMMIWHASLWCYDMQVCNVMLCKYVMQVWVECLYMLSCYANLLWVYEPKATSFMPKGCILAT